MATFSRTLPNSRTLTVISLLLLLVSLANASPLHKLRVREHSNDSNDGNDGNNGDDKDDAKGMPPNILAIIVSCSLVGALLISAAAMVLFFWCRRRRNNSKLAAAAAVNVPPTTETSHERRAELITACSWCYIAETEVCRWCSGEASDEISDDETPQRQLFFDYTDLQHCGWRSVLNSPAASLGGSPAGSMKGKRSFKPGGIYEIPPTSPLPQSPALAAESDPDAITEVERG